MDAQNQYQNPNQQINNNNQHQQRPQDNYSQPDPANYPVNPDIVSFPGQNPVKEPVQTLGQNTHGKNLIGETHYNNNGQTDNSYNKDPIIDPRAPVPNAPTNTPEQTYQRNLYSQQHINGGNRNQAYRGEPFRPVQNLNYNVNRPNQANNQPNENYNLNTNIENKFYANQQGNQNGWRINPSSQGKQNYNRVLVPQDNSNYNPSYNQNQGSQVKEQQSSHYNFNGKTNYNGATSQGNFKPDFATTENYATADQASGSQSSTQANTFNVQKDISDQEIPGSDQVYFNPQVLSQDKIDTQKFDDSPDDFFTSPGGGGNTVSGDSGFVEQKEFDSKDGITTGTTQIPATREERDGFCECNIDCAPVRYSNENLGSSIREIARSLNAEMFFDFVGQSDEELEALLSANGGSYTLFIPSNEAIARLPSNLLDHWRENNPDFTTALLNHVVSDSVSLDQLKQGGQVQSRAGDATLFINNYYNKDVTVNGHRIVYGDISAPKGGTIHVIDGTLCPVANQDIINTLRSCNKYDGFLTLADVTQLLDSMQNEGPYTVFLPSNDALTKIPLDELAILKENVTALREFLEYHIVEGAYFSGDLKDGQYLTTIYQKHPIRVGIRVDGCHRRLVEANNSPVFKSDIPTKNGVIHVIDWVMKPSDLTWCEGVILP